MTTPITELSLLDLLTAAEPSFDGAEDFFAWRDYASKTTQARWALSREVSLAQDMVNRAESRTDATPEHWKEAHGELTRLRRELHDAEGEILMLRAELERRVRRVRTGGST